MNTELFETIKQYESDASELVAGAKNECKSLYQNLEQEKEFVTKKTDLELEDLGQSLQSKIDDIKKTTQMEYDKKFSILEEKAIISYKKELSTNKSAFLKSIRL